MKILLVSAAAVLFFSGPAAAQHLYEPYSHFTTQHGLPQNSVYSMELDNRGYLWMTTYNGLVRFDGSHFSVYKPGDYLQGASNFVSWINRVNNRLFFKEYNHEYIFEITDKGKIVPVTDSAFLEKIIHNHLLQWLYPFQNTPLLSSAKKSKCLGYIYPVDSTFNSGYYMNKDYRFVYCDAAGTRNTSLYGTRLFYNFYNNCFILDSVLYTLDKNRVLMCDRQGVSMKVTQGDLLKLLQNFKPGVYTGNRFYFVVKHNTVFLVASDKIYRVIPGSRGAPGIELLAAVQSTAEIIDLMLVPGSDLLLIGTEPDGLYICKKKKFRPIVFPLPKDSNGQSSQLAVMTNDYPGPVELFRDTLFVSRVGGLLTPGGNVVKMPAGAKKIDDFFSKSTNGYFIYKDPDSTDNLLIADSNFTIVKRLPGITGSLGGYFNDGDTLYQAFYDGKIFKFLLGKDRNCTVLDTFNVSPRYYGTIYLSKVGKETLLIGLKDSLFLFGLRSKKGHLIPQFTNRLEIETMYTDRAGTVWIGTLGKSWYRYRHGEGLFRMPLDKYKYLSSVVSFTEDDKGYFWIGTFYGLFRILKSDAERVSDPDALLFYNHFTKASGFNSDEFLGEYGNTSLKFPDGRLLLCNAIGMVVFNPASVPIEQPSGQITFGNTWINGKQADIGERLVLKPDFNNFSVEVLIPFMWTPYNQQVQYKLSGGDNNWTFLSDNRIISMNRLPSGNYTLSVRMLKQYGSAEFITSTYHFRVLPHWYQTWWFFALLLLAVNLLLIWYFRHRGRAIKKQKELLETEVASRTEELRKSEELIRQNAGFKSRVTSLVLHDVRSPLFYLKKITLSIYKSTEGEVPEVYREQLKELHLSVKEVSEYAQNLFAWVSSQQDDFVMKKSRVKLFDVFEELCGNYHLLAEQNHNTIGHAASDGLVVETQADLLMIILRNLVDNAIKYTRGGRIMLSATPREDGMHILVWDTGRGMSPEKVNRIMAENTNDEADTRSGMGYRFIKDMLSKMNGRLVVKSETDVGSAITVILPV